MSLPEVDRQEYGAEDDDIIVQKNTSSSRQNGEHDPPQPAAAAADHDDAEFYQFVRVHLPKVELHAHLNGCIPLPLLRELAQERGVTLHSKYFRNAHHHDDDVDTNNSTGNYDTHDDPMHPHHHHHLRPPNLYNLHPRSLQDCFDMFAELPTIVNDLTAVRRITLAAAP